MTDPTPRDLAFSGDAEGLRKYAKVLLKRDSENPQRADALELIAFLVECDLEGAVAKIETIKHKYEGHKNYVEVVSTVNLVKAQIYFSYGKFDELIEVANHEIAQFRSGKSALKSIDILQLLRLKVQGHLILNQDAAIKEIAENLEEFATIEQSEQSLYILNSINAMHKALRGENRAALELAIRNINIAKQNEYIGVMGPLDAIYVKAQCLFAMAEENEGLEAFAQLASASKTSQIWPWYFLSDGQISRQLAVNNKLPEALAVVRAQRDLISNFRFSNGLSFLADSNELFIRSFIKDVERIETLINRMPETNLVKQIRANTEEWQGRDMLDWIKSLPKDSPRQEIYQLISFAEYFADKESIAVDYMREALVLVEENLATEFLLRQYKIYEIILKSIPKYPSVYQRNSHKENYRTSKKAI